MINLKGIIYLYKYNGYVEVHINASVQYNVPANYSIQFNISIDFRFKVNRKICFEPFLI